MKINVPLLIAILLSILMFVSGCSWFSSEDHEMEKSAKELATQGSLEFREENYKKAIKSFTTLRDWYPFSKYAILAELKIADAHYKLEDYEDARANYESFENLHPENEAIPYVIYRTGMCWYNRIEAVDKDQTPAKKAIEQFQRLVNRFPDNPYSLKTAKKISRCKESLANHEEYVANFYLKSGQHKAALKRFEEIFALYPDTEAGRRALENIALCRKILEKK
ncbi:MAG: outer membrane protein assembly factor BamD [Desulfamplus sp.]|nr:outer membrane protein assembly factor BamD [Desulfamplus sp.]MBF0411788.1 outer membrane protein assembly factor BamD [Desulfamplus sp.]